MNKKVKILMLVNWKISSEIEKPIDKQPPDYIVKGEPYWFFKHFKKLETFEIDVVDISSCKIIEKFEKNILRFYLIQTLKILFRLNQYDIIISHGMQSGVILSLIRRFFKIKPQHLVFDIGSFNSAAEKGFSLRLLQFASKSIDCIIYHTSSQIEYYKRFFPWLVNRANFVRFGPDLEFFKINCTSNTVNEENFILCIGYSKRDWKTLVSAYQMIETNTKLFLVGHVDERFSKIKNIKQINYVPINTLIEIIKKAKFCVLPLESFNYSYGQMTLMQQMALEKCCIVAKVPSLIDYVIDKENAIFYEPKNILDLKDKICKALDNEIEVNYIGKNARKFLEEENNEITMSLSIEHIIEGMIKDE